MSSARIDKVVISGVFSLDGQDFDVDNNAWLVGDDDEVLVIDAPHDPAPILAAVGGRKVTAIVLTHGHNDHITAAVALRSAVGAPIWLHPDDQVLWDMTYPVALPDRKLLDGQLLNVAGLELQVLHTPGYSPGSSCLHAAELRTVFTGDTLFCGGPGHRPVLQRQADHPELDHRPTHVAARRHRGPHRTRRRHHDHRRGRPHRLSTGRRWAGPT